MVGADVLVQRFRLPRIEDYCRALLHGFTYVDVTERARLEEELSFSNLLKTTAIENSLDSKSRHVVRAPEKRK